MYAFRPALPWLPAAVLRGAYILLLVFIPKSLEYFGIKLEENNVCVTASCKTRAILLLYSSNAFFSSLSPKSVVVNASAA
jgi:hypothetical protein